MPEFDVSPDVSCPELIGSSLLRPGDRRRYGGKRKDERLETREAVPAALIGLGCRGLQVSSADAPISGAALMARRVTRQDVALRAGVSGAAVSVVLNGSPRQYSYRRQDS